MFYTFSFKHACVCTQTRRQNHQSTDLQWDLSLPSTVVTLSYNKKPNSLMAEMGVWGRRELMYLWPSSFANLEVLFLEGKKQSPQVYYVSMTKKITSKGRAKASLPMWRRSTSLGSSHNPGRKYDQFYLSEPLHNLLSTNSGWNPRPKGGTPLCQPSGEKITAETIFSPTCGVWEVGTNRGIST